MQINRDTGILTRWSVTIGQAVKTCRTAAMGAARAQLGRLVRAYAHERREDPQSKTAAPPFAA